jgi:hypothetical protein
VPQAKSALGPHARLLVSALRKFFAYGVRANTQVVRGSAPSESPERATDGLGGRPGPASAPAARRYRPPHRRGASSSEAFLRTDRWTDGRMHGWMDGRMAGSGWTDGRTDRQTDSVLDGQTDGWMAESGWTD